MQKDEKFVYDLLQKIELPNYVQAIQDVKEYSIKQYSYPSKNRRLEEWRLSEPKLDRIVSIIFTHTLNNGEYSTYQNIVGALNNIINVEDEIDRVKIIAEIIAVVSKSGLIKIMRKGPGKSIDIYPGFNLKLDLPSKASKYDVCSSSPTEVIDNEILGHRLKSHDAEVCLDHINRMNSIPLKLNIDMIEKFPEKPSKKLDTQKKIDQWELFVRESAVKYKELIEGGNLCYMKHACDNRGRTYTSNGYYIDTQGSSYKKSIMQLKNEEIVGD